MPQICLGIILLPAGNTQILKVPHNIRVVHHQRYVALSANSCSWLAIADVGAVAYLAHVHIHIALLLFLTQTAILNVQFRVVGNRVYYRSQFLFVVILQLKTLRGISGC
jgi:hypothetical protein